MYENKVREIIRATLEAKQDVESFVKNLPKIPKL